MSGFRLMAALAVALMLCTLPAEARKRELPEPGSDAWISFGGGYYDGQNYERTNSQQSAESLQADGYEVAASLNIARPMLLRLRAAWMFDYTSNTAEEVGALVGAPLGPRRQAFLAVGVSRLTDVSNRGQSPTVGVPVELLFYPTRGLEFSIHGNFNPDSDFIGATLSGVFGKARAH